MFVPFVLELLSLLHLSKKSKVSATHRNQKRFYFILLSLQKGWSLIQKRERERERERRRGEGGRESDLQLCYGRTVLLSWWCVSDVSLDVWSLGMSMKVCAAVLFF